MSGRGLKRTRTIAFEVGEDDENVLEEARNRTSFVKLQWVQNALRTSCMGKKLYASVLSHGQYRITCGEKGNPILQYVPPVDLNATIRSNINQWTVYGTHHVSDHLVEHLKCYEKVDGEMNAVEKQLEVQKLMQKNILLHAPAYPRCKCVKCLWFKQLSFVPFAEKRKALPDATLLIAKQR